jgi:hypothetical protein
VPAKNVTGPPDFVGVGAQRSGTTWWFDLLLSHPQIRPPRGRRKELHFFDRFGGEEMHEHHIAEYHELFRRRRRQIAGEWTPRYMGDAWTGRLLRRAAPDAKLLVLLRDPVERYRASLAKRMGADSARDRGTVYTTEAVQRARYAAQLKVLSQFFDLEQVLVIQYEQVMADPIGEYARTLRFLGVDDTFVPRKFRLLCWRGRPPRDPERLLRPYGLPRWARLRRTAKPIAADVRLWPDIEETIVEDLYDDVRELPELVPDFDLSLWPAFAT